MRTILVVEEQEHQRLLYEWELADEGYRVVTVANVDEATEKMAKAPPDCIVLGIGRRCRDAPGNLRRFLESDRDIPVVVHTAFSDCGGEAVRLLTDDCVIKSSDVEELKRQVRAVLEGGVSA